MGKAASHYKIKFERKCRMCGRPDIPRGWRYGQFARPGARRLTRHHLVPSSKGGDSRNHNIVPLCRPCHNLIDCLRLKDQLPYRAMLRRLLHPGEVNYIRSKMGVSFLEKYYPSPTRMKEIRFDQMAKARPRPGHMSKKQWRKMLWYEQTHGYQIGSNGRVPVRVSSSPGVGAPG
jgi:hypothetical protein